MTSISLLALVESGKVAEAISIIEAMPNQIEASRAFIELAKQTYRELHDVSAMIAIGDAGTQFALLKATSAANSALAEDLKKQAKILAFNTAANCWPGWGDAGIDIREDDLHAGRRLAVQCRDLTEELNLGHKQRGTSLWLVGALDLAMGHCPDALAGFRRAKLEFEAAGDADLVLMAEGYAALTRKAQPESHVTGGHELARVLALLEETKHPRRALLRESAQHCRPGAYRRVAGTTEPIGAGAITREHPSWAAFLIYGASQSMA